MSRGSVTVRVARWSATHPWRAIGLWLLLVVVAVGMSAVIPKQQTKADDTWIGQSGVASELVRQANLEDKPSETVLLTDKDGPLDKAAATTALNQLRQTMTAIDAVDGVGQPVWAENGKAALLPIQLKGSADDAADNVDKLVAATADVQKANPSLQIEETGSASLDAGIWKQVGSDLARAEKLSLPITFALMLLAFGALIAAGIPVLLAFSAVGAALGFYAPLSYLFPDGGSVANVVLLIGMAVGVDYSLFYLKREREERRRGHGTVDAVEIAAATSGHSVVVSGLAVIVSMAGLYVAQDPVFSSMATATIVVVAVAVLGSLTVLPALLAKLGHRVDRPRVPLLWRLNRRIGPGGISRRILAPVLRFPKVALLLSAIAVVALAVPALGMKTEPGGLSTLPQTIPEVKTMTALQQNFPSEGMAYDVVAKGKDAATGLAKVQQSAVDSGEFVVTPGQEIRKSDETAVLTLVSVRPDTSEDARVALERLRNDLVPAALTGTTWAVGGETASSVDYGEHQRNQLPYVIAFVLSLTLVMMVFTFRSVAIALVTTLLNLASVAACFGVLSLVFQHTWAEGLLDFTSPGFVVSWIPVFLFVILVGLSMDYHVFVLGRIREGVQEGLSPQEAVRKGITESAGVVTSAAAVMVSVFAVFATLGMIEMKQMGVGLAVAVLIDATLVRIVILPSIMVLLGRKAWWPNKLSKEPAAPEVQEPELVSV
ncbi:RND superfamily putative drug exporter [Kribbella orskensis]|uniref:RND superfamily putative drug exporter n=1 Tax=Kribbella orskensis TaxID=2512216 RepID=A0ABY2BK71_9ACTN|nr:MULTISPECIES: MMPL family transporter [Kribbella]TCN40395.1 RND superfamily putative drug exporter [Kribbella sp. VKM Ac-2500]TCO23015.1 RND superfamily putative drug exporter [Kribbella orskensis]